MEFNPEWFVVILVIHMEFKGMDIKCPQNGLEWDSNGIDFVFLQSKGSKELNFSPKSCTSRTISSFIYILPWQPNISILKKKHLPAIFDPDTLAGTSISHQTGKEAGKTSTQKYPAGMEYGSGPRNVIFAKVELSHFQNLGKCFFQVANFFLVNLQEVNMLKKLPIWKKYAFWKIAWWKNTNFEIEKIPIQKSRFGAYFWKKNTQLEWDDFPMQKVSHQIFHSSPRSPRQGPRRWRGRAAATGNADSTPWPGAHGTETLGAWAHLLGSNKILGKMDLRSLSCFSGTFGGLNWIELDMIHLVFLFHAGFFSKNK